MVWVTPDEEKHRQGFISHLTDFITKQTKNNFITEPSKSLHHKLHCIIQVHTDKTQKLINNRTCFFELGQQQQWEAITPYQLLESAQTMSPQDPRACSGLPGWN